MQSLSIWHSFIIAILISACVARAISLSATAINKRTQDDRSVKDHSSVVPVTGTSGFGGWLALVTVGVFVSPPVTIVKMLGINSGFEDFDFQAFWFMLDGDIGIHLTVIFMQICTAVFMVLRSKRFVSVYIVTSICIILLLPTEKALGVPGRGQTDGGVTPRSPPAARKVAIGTPSRGPTLSVERFTPRVANEKQAHLVG